MPKDTTPGKPTTRRYSPEEKAAAVRMVKTLRAELGTEHGTELLPRSEPEPAADRRAVEAKDVSTPTRVGSLPRETRRLYLVAGPAGSGKTTLARVLAHELDAGLLQLDSIWLAMKVAAGEEGTPARDVLDIDCRMRREDEADDDVLAAFIAASGEVCRALPTVLELEFQAHERLVVDGAWLLPSVVKELTLGDAEVRAVYIVQRTEPM